MIDLDHGHEILPVHLLNTDRVLVPGLRGLTINNSQLLQLAGLFALVLVTGVGVILLIVSVFDNDIKEFVQH